MIKIYREKYSKIDENLENVLEKTPLIGGYPDYDSAKKEIEELIQEFKKDKEFEGERYDGKDDSWLVLTTSYQYKYYYNDRP